ncbi:P-loop containing nucleoside triphosphate hydrolase protein [Phlyctochytrium arcticum]|nr:P-loop containing nucleoside triphosphate hydrolase protein [Phlyctochytrium arcticum]
MAPPTTAVLKVVIIGDGSVGKTSLRNQYMHQRFSHAYKATIGADFVTRTVSVGDRNVAIQIWDTAGQERFQSLGVAFYRGADACILVYDVTNPASTASLYKWMTEFIRQADIRDPERFPFVLVGNKMDDTRGRAVSKWEGQELAPSLPLFETSAKDGTRVEDVFMYVAKTAVVEQARIQQVRIEYGVEDGDGRIHLGADDGDSGYNREGERHRPRIGACNC